MKYCSRCETEKATTEFYKNRRRKDGLHNWCKECSKKHQNARYRNDPEYRERIKRESREWHEEHPERAKELTQRWRKENRDKINAQKRERYATDPEYREKSREYSRQWREANPEKKRESDRAWYEQMKADPERWERYLEQQRRYWKQAYAKNPDKFIQAVLRSRAKNPEHYGRYAKLYVANARAEEWGIEGKLTFEDIISLEEKYGKSCHLCGAKYGDDNEKTRMNLDHIVPLGLGGPNTVENCQLICEGCHDRKNGQDVPMVRASNPRED